MVKGYFLISSLEVTVYTAFLKQNFLKTEFPLILRSWNYWKLSLIFSLSTFRKIRNRIRQQKLSLRRRASRSMKELGRETEGEFFPQYKHKYILSSLIAEQKTLSCPNYFLLTEDGPRYLDNDALMTTFFRSFLIILLPLSFHLFSHREQGTQKREGKWICDRNVEKNGTWMPILFVILRLFDHNGYPSVCRLFFLSVVDVH